MIDLLSNFDAFTMPNGIIDYFKIINVDKSNSKLAAGGRVAIQRFLQAVAKHGAVGQLRQFIVRGQKFNAPLGDGNFFYVGKYADIVGYAPAQVAYHLDVQPFKVKGAVLFFVPDFAFPPAVGKQLIPHG